MRRSQRVNTAGSNPTKNTATNAAPAKRDDGQQRRSVPGDPINEPMAFLTFVTTSLAAQISHLVKNFPAFRTRLEGRLPTNYPVLKRIVDEIFALPSSPEIVSQLERPLALGSRRR